MTDIQQILRTKIDRFLDWRLALLAGLALVAVDWIFFVYVFHFDLMISDVADYWGDSSAWKEPFNPVHMPGYPLAIAAVRGVVGDLMRPLVIMQAFAVVSFSVGVWAVFSLAGFRSGVNNNLKAFLAVGLFVLWPLVGTTYVPHPVADLFAMALLLAGMWFLMKNRSLSGAILLGLALVSHKGLWHFAALIMVVHVISVRTTLSLIAAGLMATPLAALWLLGAFHHDSVFWLLSRSISVEVDPVTSLPVFDGLIGTFWVGGTAGIFKGLMVIGLLVLAIAVAVKAWRLPHADETKWYSLAIAISLIGLIVVLNEHTMFASIRFGRLLAVPLVWQFGDTIVNAFTNYPGHSHARIGIVSSVVLALFGSQLAFAYFMAEIWET